MSTEDLGRAGFITQEAVWRFIMWNFEKIQILIIQTKHNSMLEGEVPMFQPCRDAVKAWL